LRLQNLSKEIFNPSIKYRDFIEEAD
jgi:hypothetical protein